MLTYDQAAVLRWLADNQHHYGAKLSNGRHIMTGKDETTHFRLRGHASQRTWPIALWRSLDGLTMVSEREDRMFEPNENGVRALSAFDEAQQQGGGSDG